ncbi:predicted protein [Naegleria gruberi]|uniref:Predicted protein n=1 Tax=Naegleria gruberi TaxID=5762 RepID=D2VTG4_NAEGR|nr:uncharacterized protein NAEGRDRAFT_72291 [Naegleria gruberi]EFC39930.1 predicted protein [Naegleria gruberi]|eukprot:XP_002672674.1 predicted protein [Naegleria gruberi strain NEG-M]
MKTLQPVNLFVVVVLISCFAWTVRCFSQTKPVDFKLTTLLGEMYGEGVKATQVGMTFPLGVAVSPLNGNVYFSDMYNHQVRYVDSNGFSHLAAGSPTLAAGESSYFTLANDTLLTPSSVALNSNGELYIAEYARIRKVYFNSTINNYNMVTFAGGGFDSSSSGVSPLSVSLNQPRCVVPVSNGDVFICDTYNYRIRKVVNGIIYNIVGSGVKGNSAEGSLALYSNVGEVWAIVFNPVSGEMYFSDFDNNAIKYIANNGSVYTYVSSFGPKGIVFDSNGDLYVAEATYDQIVKFSNGVRTVIANNAGITPGFSGDGGNALNATFHGITSLAIYGKKLYIADASNNRIRHINLTTNIINTIAGDGSEIYTGGTSGYQSTIALKRPYTSFYNNQTDELLIADTNNYRVLRVNSLSNIESSSLIETVAGVVGLVQDDIDGKLGNETALNYPYSVTQSEISGDVFIGTTFKILKVSKKDKRVSTVAGSVSTLAGDNFNSIASQLNEPAGLAFAINGDLYICDSINHAIRKIDHETGIISTIAGNGIAGFKDGNASIAQFNSNLGLSVLPNGDLLIADYNNNRIRKYLASSKQVLTIAGGLAGYSGDGQLATSAQLNHPTDVAYNASTGDVFIADFGNKVIRKISNSTGIISTIAGSGLSEYNGDAMPASISNISPYGLSIHPITGELFISDSVNYLIRKINVNNQIIYNVAGVNGTSIWSTTGLANSTSLGSLGFITFSPKGDLFIAKDKMS